MPVIGPADMRPVVSLADVRAALNQVSGVNDLEVLRLLTAAEAEYEASVGPLAGPVTDTFQTSGGVIILQTSRALAVLSVTYASGRVGVLSDYTVQPRSGLIFGPFGYGTVTVTYSLSPVPQHHYETIVADVAGYFEATQRGGQGGALPEDGYGAAFSSSGTPLTLFPRIRKLAGPRYIA